MISLIIGVVIIYKTGNKKLIGEINKSLILKIIRENGPISRADIARITGLNPATVSGNVEKFLKRKIIKELGSGESSGGRKPILLELNEEGFFCIGVDMGKTKITVAIVNLEGQIKDKVIFNINSIDDKKDIIDITKSSIYEVIHKSGLKSNVFLGIGVGVHGVVNSKKGVSIFAPEYNWRNVKIKEILQDEFNLPVSIDNDVRVMAFGEKWFGAAKGIEDFVIINVGNGIGSGIMINGRLYTGSGYAAGEVGHISVLDNGPKCICGNYGCLDAVASGQALAKKVVAQIQMGTQTIITEMVNHDLTKIDGETIYMAAKMGDSLAINSLAEIGRFIGIGVSYIINLLNPKMIIIGGGVSLAGDLVLDSLIEVARKKSMKECFKDVKIKQSSLKENCGVIGAATLVLNEEFHEIMVQ